MPIIFSSALLVLPVMLLTRMPASWEWAHILAGKFIPGNPFYLIGDGILILFFSYFWVATQFNPVQIADDLKRSGGYVPGIRPGRPTAEYLDKVMARITLMGALFLTMIAVLPSVLSGPMFNIPWAAASFFGGTSLLIIVGVTLDTMRQVEAHLLMRNYDGFLKKGKLRGRY
jgi:preprotein translocase subunit SecY